MLDLAAFEVCAFSELTGDPATEAAASWIERFGRRRAACAGERLSGEGLISVFGRGAAELRNFEWGSALRRDPDSDLRFRLTPRGGRAWESVRFPEWDRVARWTSTPTALICTGSHAGWVGSYVRQVVVAGGVERSLVSTARRVPGWKPTYWKRPCGGIAIHVQYPASGSARLYEAALITSCAAVMPFRGLGGIATSDAVAPWR